MTRDADTDAGPTPLGAVLALTFLASLGTGVFWHGVPFIAKHTYAFSQTRNLLLYLAMGVVYTVGAFTAGRVTRALRRRATPRRVLAACLALLTVVCFAPPAVRSEWPLWAAALLGQYLSSVIWPLIESYVTAGRHGSAMRSAIGAFNLTWAPAVAVPLFAMAPILEHHGQWAIGGFGAASLAGLATLAWFRPRPGHHDPAVAVTHVGREYALLLSSARVLLPLSYVLNSAMNPILPYRLEALGVEVWWETPATATWTVVRVAAFVALWRVAFWHGRWGALLLGATAMTGGFALVVAGPALLLVLLGFALLGVGMGIVYYAALYYAMSVGGAQVEAGGTHEALIGAGYATGPLAGLVGSALAGPVGVVAITSGLVGLGGAQAARPYLRARKLRRR